MLGDWMENLQVSGDQGTTCAFAGETLEEKRERTRVEGIEKKLIELAKHNRNSSCAEYVSLTDIFTEEDIEFASIREEREVYCFSTRDGSVPTERFVVKYATPRAAQYISKARGEGKSLMAARLMGEALADVSATLKQVAVDPWQKDVTEFLNGGRPVGESSSLEATDSKIRRIGSDGHVAYKFRDNPKKEFRLPTDRTDALSASLPGEIIRENPILWGEAPRVADTTGWWDKDRLEYRGVWE